MSSIDERKMAAFAKKVKEDRKWYIENFLKIRNKQAKLVPFRYNTAQEIFESIIEKNTAEGRLHRYIVLKARQMGLSTFTEGLIFHGTATEELINSLIIAHEDKATQNLFNMSKLFYDELPMSLQPMKKYSNEKALVFENPSSDPSEKQTNPGLRSKITVATAGTAEAGRSGTYHKVHVSEIAFFPNPKNTMTALLQCVPDEPNTFVCMESTANGVGGYFYDMWNDAVAGKNDFTPIFLPWFTEPTYSRAFRTEEEKQQLETEIGYQYRDAAGKLIRTDEAILMEEFHLTLEQMNWRKWTIANKCGGDLEMFKQEYPSNPQEAFIASGRPRFDLKAVKELEIAHPEPLHVCDLEKTSKNGWKIIPNAKSSLKIYREPIEGEVYTIGADVAEGLIHGDFSTAVVLDRMLQTVAVYRGHIDPDLFGKELVKLGWFYNEAYLAVESNNHGLTTLKSILNEDYHNLFYTKTYDRVNDEISKKLGWATNVRTKPMAIDKLAEYIRERYLAVLDLDTIMEMYSYVIDEKGRTNAQQGKHDDCIMALAIALMAFLEGRGDDYIPEISREDSKTKKKERFDIPDIVDPLFEDEGEHAEFSQ